MSPDAAYAPEALASAASATAPPPHWDEQLLALRDGQRLRTVTAAAARVHVRAGMTVAAARGRCATLDVRDWDDACVTRELARTSAAFLSASPQVAPAAGMPGTWWIGATGFDGLGGERALAGVLQQMARVWHPSARVCVADSCVAARAGTWGAADGRGLMVDGRTRDGDDDAHSAFRIIQPGGDTAYLAPLPLALIPMDPEVREALVALGLGTCGALAALSSGDVERRWGAAGLSAWRLAQGIDPRRPVLTPISAARQAHAELALSTTSAEPVLFLVRGALERLMADLVRDGRAAAAVAITLTLDDGRGALPSGGIPHTITREVRAPRALARVSPWFERCRALLDSWTLTAPVSAVTVAITTVAPLGAEQGDLLAPAWRDPAAAEAAFERLRSTLGAQGVVRPVARDAYCPEREGIWERVEVVDGHRQMVDGRGLMVDRTNNRAVIASSTIYHPPSTIYHLPSTISLRLLESPEPINIIASPQGEPRALHWRGRRIPIARARGPERLSGAWWTEAPFARDYWRCESDELEQEFLLYRDQVGWKLQGWYD
jgi:protein ImuB